MDGPLLPSVFWGHVTRLGEAQIVLPVVFLACLCLGFEQRLPLVSVRWLAAITAAAFVTTLTKVAFIGWGLGWSALDFTGISGHAMFAAAAYPVVGALVLGPRTRRALWLGFSAGVTLAVLIGVSRMAVGAHSASEVVAGLLLGSGAALAAGVGVDGHGTGARPLIALLLVPWLWITPQHAPASRTHDMVTRLSLRVSGHKVPFTRVDLLGRAKTHSGTGRRPASDSAV